MGVYSAYREYTFIDPPPVQEWPGLKITSTQDNTYVSAYVYKNETELETDRPLGISPDIYISRDGINWEQANNIIKNNIIGTPNNKFLINAGESLYIWNKNNILSQEVYYDDLLNIHGGYFNFSFATYTGSILTPTVTNVPVIISGNVNSMINFNEISNNCFQYLFRNTLITTPPELPSITLANNCYYGMFQGCTNLITAPNLPAINLAKSCYLYMFENCTSLATPPGLPATTLVQGCYVYMFSNCTNLTTPPELPATNLARYCYEHMFAGCSSLTTAPELPATNLADGCYVRMFENCTSLNRIKLYYTGGFDFMYFGSRLYDCGWVYNVNSQGILYYNGPDTTRDEGAIPEGWTVQTF